MATKRDYYEILGVQKGAGVDEIKAAYRKLAMQFHPDRNKDAGAEEKFKEISEAYAALSDPKKRQVYDQYGHSGFDQRYSQEDVFRGADFEDVFRSMGFDFGGMGGGSASFGDIFSMFGGGGRQPGYGSDLSAEVVISLQEAAAGAKRTLEVPHTVKCEKCRGSGAAPGTDLLTCPKCYGQGQVQHIRSLGAFGRFATVTTCPGCKGRGQVPDKECPTCKGSCIVRKTDRVEADIPPGIEDGMRIRLQDMGEAGPAGAGDLYVRVRIKSDARFSRDGDDLYIEQPISFSQAALGDKVQVPTLNGNATVTVPAGTPSHTLLRLRGEGMPQLRTRGRGGAKGDLLVRVIVSVPKNLSDKQKELLREFDRTAGKKGWF